MSQSYDQLEAGYEFPPGNYKIDFSGVALFLKATGDTSEIYQDTRLVPPMVVAALALAALSNTIGLPPGSVHISQELCFVKAVNTNENLTSHARISRAQKRGGLHIIAVDIDVHNEARQTVLTGKTSFILPRLEGER
jgi:acyl dehydratase